MTSVESLLMARVTRTRSAVSWSNWCGGQLAGPVVVSAWSSQGPDRRWRSRTVLDPMPPCLGEEPAVRPCNVHLELSERASSREQQMPERERRDGPALFVAPVTHSSLVTNRLADETSPYLLQHAHNPVDWYPWGPEALGKARELDRPIFLSIGYSACHWCHVMERESFENEDTAAQLNRDFVAIKVDREERPDLDDIYMAAVQALTGSGGWPMSVFLTPELEPFFGGTYFPPDDRHGMPAFRRVLDAVTDAYRNRRADVATQGAQLARHLRESVAIPAGTQDPGVEVLERAAARLGASFDAVHGGFGGAPKFPAPMTLEFLLRMWRRSHDEGAAGHGDPHARSHGRRRHPRPARRRLRPLQHRRPLAGAALREDALRQRAAGARLPRGVSGHRQRALRHGRDLDRGLHGARARDR